MPNDDFFDFLAHLSIACTVPYDIKWVYHMKKKVDAMSKAEKKQDARHSVWEIQSRIYDDGGNEIFTEQMINDYLASHDNVKWYAWIVHDKDVYTEEDKLKATDNTDRVKVGELKPRHIHLVLQFSSRMRQSTLAKAFNLDARYVRLPEVYNKKLQIPAIVTYMTHEKQPDKHHYDPELMQTSTPDIIRPMVDDFKENHSKGHVSKKSRKVLARKLVEQISRGEITLPEIKEEWGLNFYFDFESHFLKARQEYMKMKCVMKPRINFYIEGESGVGKSTVARMLAKTLGREVFAKQMMEERTTTHQYKDDELYLEVGEKRCVSMHTKTNMHKKLVMFTLAWNDDEETFAVTKAYYDKICDYMQFENLGSVVGKGCGTPPMTAGTDYPKMAYELGLSI